jgi:hypothetical protein
LAAAEVGGVVLVIDAKNERVAAWYASYGAVPLLDASLTLLQPLVMVEAAIRKAVLAQQPGFNFRPQIQGNYHRLRRAYGARRLA